MPKLAVDELTIQCDGPDGRILPLDGFSMKVLRGQIVGLVGESGSGKTTLVRTVTGLLGRNCKVGHGRAQFDGREVVSPKGTDLGGLRGREIGVIFQSAMSSLNPLLKVDTQLSEALRALPDRGTTDDAAWTRDLLKRMGFEDVESVLHSYPHELSGGMAQRVAIAIAMSCRPSLVVADECTTALDVTIQAEVVALLRGLVETTGTSLLFVTHDLALASDLCDQLAVVYAGHVVEMGATSDVMSAPRHPYTRALLDAVPAWGARRSMVGIDGTPPVVRPNLQGCRFAERCPRVRPDCRLGAIGWSGSDSRGFRCLYPLHEATKGPRA